MPRARGSSVRRAGATRGKDRRAEHGLTRSPDTAAGEDEESASRGPSPARDGLVSATRFRARVCGEKVYANFSIYLNVAAKPGCSGRAARGAMDARLAVRWTRGSRAVDAGPRAPEGGWRTEASGPWALTAWISPVSQMSPSRRMAPRPDRARDEECRADGLGERPRSRRASDVGLVAHVGAEPLGRGRRRHRRGADADCLPARLQAVEPAPPDHMLISACI